MVHLSDQLSELRADPDQIEQLVQAIVEIGSVLDLQGTLQRIVKAAVDLTGVRPGALRVSAADGLLIDDLDAYPPSVKAQTGATKITAVLAVPIRVRSAEFGYLYLSDDRPDRVFCDSQKRVVRILVSAAAVAIDNARLFEQKRETAKWTRASREITSALLSGDPQTGPL